jgi:hypothetical protein
MSMVNNTTNNYQNINKSNNVNFESHSFDNANQSMMMG